MKLQLPDLSQAFGKEDDQWKENDQWKAFCVYPSAHQPRCVSVSTVIPQGVCTWLGVLRMWLQLSLPGSSAQWPRPSHQAASDPSPAAHPQQQHHTHPWGTSSSPHSTGTLCPPFPWSLLLYWWRRGAGESFFVAFGSLHFSGWNRGTLHQPFPEHQQTEAVTQGLSLCDFAVAKMATKAVQRGQVHGQPWHSLWVCYMGWAPVQEQGRAVAGREAVWAHTEPRQLWAPLTEPWWEQNQPGEWLRHTLLKPSHKVCRSWFLWLLGHQMLGYLPTGTPGPTKCQPGASNPSAVFSLGLLFLTQCCTLVSSLVIPSSWPGAGFSFGARESEVGRVNLKACSPSLTTLGLSSSCSLHSERASWGCSASPETPSHSTAMACHPPGMPMSCHVFQLLPLPSLEGARAPLQGWAAQAGWMCHPWQPGGDRELPLGWEKGAPSELSSTFPLVSPAPSAPSMAPHFPLDTRPYSSPRGLRLPTHPCTDTSIPLGAAELASARGWVSHPPAHPCPYPTARAWPLQGNLLSQVKPLYFINCSTKPTSDFAGALQHSSCFTLGVGAAEICSFWPLQNFLEVFNTIWWDVISVVPEGTQAMELAACLPRWLGGAWAALGGRWDTGHSSVVRRGFCYTFSCL